VDFDPGVDQLAEIRPVFEVSGATVDLVNDDTLCLALPEQPKHFREFGPPAFRGGPAFLKPRTDREALRLGITKNRGALLRQRYAIALLGRGDPDVTEEGKSSRFPTAELDTEWAGPVGPDIRWSGARGAA
jgi:hypothetical protein